MQKLKEAQAAQAAQQTVQQNQTFQSQSQSSLPAWASVAAPGAKQTVVSTTQQSASVKPTDAQAQTQMPELNEPVQAPTSTPTHVVYRIKPFKDNDHGVAYRQGFLKSFMDMTKQVQYSLVGNRAGIIMYATVPTDIAMYFENVFYSSYPTSELVRDALDLPPTKFRVSYGEKDTIATDKDYMKESAYLDPMRDLFGVYDSIDTTDRVSLSFTHTFKSEKSSRQKFIETINTLTKALSRAKPTDAKPTDGKDEKIEDAITCKLGISIGYAGQSPVVEQGLKTTFKALFGKFLQKGSVTVSPDKKTTKMTLPQVSNFFHIPTANTIAKNLDYSVYRKLPYPANLPTPDNTERNALTLLGKTDYRGQMVRFGVKDEDSFRHLYIVGKTGTGKSTFMSNIIKSHMYTNKGLCLIDPHGDLVETVLEHIPSRRTNDVILFDVGDTQNPIGFNLLQYKTEDEKNLIVSGVVSTFKKIFGNSWGPRLEYVLRNVMLSVVEYPNATMMHIMRMLTDKQFREEVLEHVKDPIVLKFRRTEFDKRSDTQRNEAIAPITNKVGQFLSSPIVRNIFGQPSSSLNIRKVMDEGKILLVNLSKGKIGEDNTEMIGSFIVTKMQIDAMSRTDIPEKDRRPFYLHIDEFQNFATDSFAVILSEARKYRLALIVANQYTSQLNEVIRDAIFGNVGSMVAFNIGYEDAQFMSSQFKELVSSNDLISVPKFRAYIRLMVDGIMSDVFSMSTIPLSQPELGPEIKDKIRAQSRQRYSMDRNKLEELVKIWANKTFSPMEKAVEKAMAENVSGPIVEPAVNSTPSNSAQTSQVSPSISATTSAVVPPLASKIAPPASWTKQAATSSIESSLPPWSSVPVPTRIPTQTTSAVSPNDSTDVQVNAVGIPITQKTSFTIDDVKIGDRFDGIVKLKYNYGLFVMVKWVEGLLHKWSIKVPDGIARKDVYNIGDKIRVKVSEFKDINGVKRVVWVQE